MTKPVSAFILAAGLGERLRPITLQTPKPLLPIIGSPLIQLILDSLSRLPIAETGLNLHYKGDQIAQWLLRNGYTKVRIFTEDPILGTGGALKNAESMLSGNTFLVHNADIMTDLDLAALIEAHRAAGHIATLAVHNYPRFNNLLIDDKGLITGIRRSSSTESGPFRQTAFTGVAVYEPQFLSCLPTAHSSVVDAWITAAAAGAPVGSYDVTGCYWSDIGTPRSYASTVADMMRKEGETVFVHRTVRGCDSIEMDALVVVGERCRLASETVLRNCIVLPETDLGAGIYENCIVGQGFTVPFEERALGGLTNGGTPIPIGTGGSDRGYFRLRRDGGSAILLQTVPGDPDFPRQVEYTKFFRRRGIPVPALFSVDMTAGTAVFEDLGDLSLYAWLHCPRSVDQIEGMYRRIMDILVALHTSVTSHLDECPALADRVFDYAYLRWETDYFLHRFLKGIRNIDLPESHGVRDELHRLALRVDAFAKTIIHRDMQSQNVMITKGGVPRIIDYQGARIGPPGYDIASLLWDPYAPLNGALREQLLFYYIERVSLVTPDFSGRDFLQTVLPCRLQRHMQALGAYGFLSKVKGKNHFLKFAPEGLSLLKKDVAEAKGDYPCLHELISGL